MSPSVCCSIHSCPAQQKRQCWQAWPCRVARVFDTRHKRPEWPGGFSSSIQRPAGRCKRPGRRESSLPLSSFFRSPERLPLRPGAASDPCLKAHRTAASLLTRGPRSASGFSRRNIEEAAVKKFYSSGPALDLKPNGDT